MSTAALPRRLVPPLATALCILASVTSGATAQAACVRDASHIRIENFGCVNANYFRGAEPDDEEYGRLAEFGIRTIVDLRGDDVDRDDRARAERLGMVYVHIPMTTRQAPTDAVIEHFLRVVGGPEHQPVYVHCVGGRHRTGVMTAVYRMAQEGWSADRAYQEMRKHRFGPGYLHPELRAAVYRFAATREGRPASGARSMPAAANSGGRAPGGSQ